MGDLVAVPGERVMDAQTGKVICRVQRNISRYEPMSVDSFHAFEPDEKPFQRLEALDLRCIRRDPSDLGWQIFVEGEWRPRP